MPSAPPERILRALGEQAPGGFLTAPFQFLLTGEDGLRLAVLNLVAGVRLELTGRWLARGSTKVDAFSMTFLPSSDGTESVIDMALGAGALLNLVVRPLDQQVEVGQCFVRVDVIRGTGATTTLGTLIAGHVGGWGGRAWPGSPLEPPVNGPGWVRAVQASAVGAGLDPSVTGAFNVRWRIKSVTAFLLTSATVINRTPELQWSLNGVTCGRVQSTLDQGATAGRWHTFMAGAAPPAPPTPFAGYGPLPSDFELAAAGLASSFTIAIVTANLQPGDQWSNMAVLVEQWLNPPTVLNAITPF